MAVFVGAACVAAGCVSTAKLGGIDGAATDAGGIDAVFEPPPGGPAFVRDFTGRPAPPFIGDGGAPPADPGAAVSSSVDTTQILRSPSGRAPSPAAASVSSTRTPPAAH